MPEIQKLDLYSLNIPEEKIRELKNILPEVFTEGDKIDFDKLKLALGENIDAGKERYGMHWPGKADCFKIIQQPSIATLLPDRNESVNFDETENIFIEGDNLEVLKLLQKSYFGKIKMIYIDPPYNTGNDFVYPDDYSDNLRNYLEMTGQTDSEGKKYSTNPESDGRFHSKWLNMIYPRLYLARNLLSEDGVVFISIDDNEVDNLKKICNEVFGEENFIDCIIWKKRYGGGAKEKYLVTLHEYVLFYSKNVDSIEEIFVPINNENITRYYKLKDDNFEKRGPYRTHPLEAVKSMGERKNLIYPIPAPDGTNILPKKQWIWSKERVMNALKNKELEFNKGKDGWTIHTKQYLKNDEGNVREGKVFSIIDDIYTQHGTNEFVNIFGNARIFSFPKPSSFIGKLIEIGLENSDIILDFFAGSCTTAHAVMELNKEDGGNRNFICVQLPEPTEETSEAYKAGYKTIADIGKERIRRVIKKISEESALRQVQGALELSEVDEKTKLDLGFKVFKLQPSNFKIWNGNLKPEELEKQIDLQVDHINPRSSEEDILFEILLKSGFSLSVKIEKLMIESKNVYSIESGTMLICLEKELTEELIKAIAERKPVRIVLLDEGFKGNDQSKTNALQIMKTKGVESFRTV